MSDITVQKFTPDGMTCWCVNCKVSESHADGPNVVSVDCMPQICEQTMMYSDKDN